MRFLQTLIIAFMAQICVAQDFEISTLSYEDIGYVVLSKADEKGEILWKSNLIPKNKNRISSKNTIGAISKKDSTLYIAIASKDIVVYKINYNNGLNLGQIKIANPKDYSSLQRVSLPVENIYSVNSSGGGLLSLKKSSQNKFSDIIMAIDDYGSVYINYYRFDRGKPLASSYFSKFNNRGNKIWEKKIHKVDPYGKKIYTGVNYMDELKKGCMIVTRSEGGLGYVQVYDNSKTPKNEYQWAFKSKNYNSQNNENLYYTYFIGNKKKGYNFKVYDISNKSTIDIGDLDLGKVKVEKDNFSYDIDKDQSSVFSFLTSEKLKLKGKSKKTRYFTNTVVSYGPDGSLLGKKDFYSKDANKRPILRILSLNNSGVLCYNNGRIELFDITLKKLLKSKDLLEFDSDQEEMVYKSKNSFIFKSRNKKFILVDLY